VNMAPLTESSRGEKVFEPEGSQGGKKEGRLSGVPNTRKAVHINFLKPGARNQ